MTNVEHHSTAPPGKRKRSAPGATVLAGVVVTVLCVPSLLAWAPPAGAASLPGARAEAAQITAQLQVDSQRLDVLSQNYDAASQNLAQIDGSLTRTRGAIGRDRQRVAADQVDLRHDAIAAYVSGDEDSGLQALFGGTGQKAENTAEYQTVATGNISGDVDALDLAQSRLDVEEARLVATQSQATAALAQVTASRQAAAATVQAQEQTLSQVKGQIATLVAQQQAEAQAAQYAAFQKRVAPTAPAVAPVTPDAPPPPPVTAAGGAATAVHAAESQIGVPYRWGGEDPGVGFDCSGLTQWAWGQAGVGIPRTAQGQYDAVAHIPLSALEPGDLIFWGSGPGGISHVGMYVGGGEIVHAPDTGETVQIAPIWNSDLVGAGRP